MTFGDDPSIVQDAVEESNLSRYDASFWSALGTQEVADALEWVITYRGVAVVHNYLDDFITLSPPMKMTCGENM